MIKKANIMINMKNHDKSQRVLPTMTPIEIRSCVDFLKRFKIKPEMCVLQIDEQAQR
jgi:hypothetical protein